jgi:hypothetical protein
MKMISLPLYKKMFLFYAFLFVLSFALGGLGIPHLVSVIDKVITRTGEVFSGLVIIVSLVIFPLWIWLILRGDFLKALGLQILLLNISGRAGDLFGVVAYASGTGFEQKVSLTTLMIFFLFFYLLMVQARLRKPEHSFKIFEGLLWMFAILTTISQFVNHTAFTAFWLSIGGIWQYVALFYVVSAIVKSQNDIRYLVKCIVWTILFSILFRIGIRGQMFLVMDAGFHSYQRLGSVSFGPSVYYAGYVALVIILAFYLLRTAQKRSTQVGWIMVLGILLIELLITFTRGGILALLFLALLPLWKQQRTYFAKIIISALLSSALLSSALLSFTVLGQKLVELINYRGLFLGVHLLETESVAIRLWLCQVSLPHFFDRFGLGYGIGNALYFSNTAYYLGRELPTHSMILETSQMAGGIAALILIAIYGFVWWQLWQISRREGTALTTTATFFLVALLSWFFFANTTGVGILVYAPYEATILMYLVLFMASSLFSVGSIGSIGQQRRQNFRVCKNQR